MKRGEINSLAHSLCAYLCSRNNDIDGYWGIGVLCAAARRRPKPEFGFKIYPGELIRIHNHEISGSKTVTDKLVKFKLDSVEGRISFFQDGRYSRNGENYTCIVAIAVAQDGRMGLRMSYVGCRPHDPTRESRRRMKN